MPRITAGPIGEQITKICKKSPGTGHQRRELIGQETNGKEEKGGVQPMGEQQRNLTRDGREGLTEGKSEKAV